METIIDERHDGVMLRTYLERELRISRREIILLKKRGDGIMLNGVRVTVRAVLRAGDRLALNDSDEGIPADIVPTDASLDILYEDGLMLAVSKPPFTPTHPSFNHFDDTLANAVAGYFRRTGGPSVFRPVNRLDRDTSGVVLIAKSMHAACLLSGLVSARNVRKVYTAVLRGTPEPESGTIDLYIRREAESIIRRIALPGPEEGAREAHTHYRVLGTSPDGGLSAVSAEPLTGRTHQLRVHFAAIGCPVAGDTLYGSSEPGISRQALHASRLFFIHPLTGETVDIRAPLPEDIRQLIEVNRIEYGTDPS